MRDLADPEKGHALGHAEKGRESMNTVTRRTDGRARCSPGHAQRRPEHVAALLEIVACVLDPLIEEMAELVADAVLRAGVAESAT